MKVFARRRVAVLVTTTATAMVSMVGVVTAVAAHAAAGCRVDYTIGSDGWNPP